MIRQPCVLALTLTGASFLALPSSPDTQTLSISRELSARAADDGYMDYAELRDAIRQLDRAHEACTVEVIGKSRKGRDIHALTLASKPEAHEDRPAILMTAGLDGRHRVGTETAYRVARQLLDEHGALLEHTTVYVIPLVNPDGMQLNLDDVNTGHIGTLTPVDNDRDGRMDEDGPVDLNGDGVITMMRRLDPPIDDHATHVADPADPRLLKTPDALEGERAMYALYPEGLDQDGDGRIAEDGTGFVDLDRNFMQAWPEHDADAGRYPLSEPESHALAQFVLDRKNIVAAITYGRHDNMVNVPDGRGSDISGRGPKTLDSQDVALYKRIAEMFKDATGQANAPKNAIEGAFHHWLYAQRGLTSIATTVWGRPEIEKSKDERTEQRQVAADQQAEARGVAGDWTGTITVPQMGELDYTLKLEQGDGNAVSGDFTTSMFTVPVEGSVDPNAGTVNLTGRIGQQADVSFSMTRDGNRMTGTITSPDGESVDINATRADAAQEESRQPTKRPIADAADKDAAAWLRYSDDARGGAGFIEWTPFDHPTLGQVEIGGFVPGFQMNPPVEKLDDLGSKQTAFAVSLIEHRPIITVDGPVVTKLAAGLYDVRFAVVNEGLLPTMTAQARKARSVLPIVVRLETPLEQIVSGDRVSRAWGIDGSGGRNEHHWIIRVDDGTTQTIELINPQFGHRTITFQAR